MSHIEKINLDIYKLNNDIHSFQGLLLNYIELVKPKKVEKLEDTDIGGVESNLFYFYSIH